MSKIIVLILLIFILSCSKKKEIPKFENIYNNELSKLDNDEQFLFDKLELFFFSGKYDTNEVKKILNYFSEKYKYQKSLYQIVLLNETPKITLDKKFYNLLMKFQDSKNVLSFLAKNYSKGKYTERTFYTLYALNYNFSKDDFKKFSEDKKLKDFIEINFLSKKKDYCVDGCSNSLDDKEKYISQIKDNFFKGKFNKESYNSYKKLLEKISTIQKDIFKLQKKIKKLARKKKMTDIEEEDLQELKDLMSFYTKVKSEFEKYLFFIGKSRRLEIKNRFSLVKELYINKTPLNKKMTTFVIKELNKKSFLIKSSFYNYIMENGDKTLLKKRWFKKTLNKYIVNNGYSLYKYGFYRRYFPERFKKIDPKKYKYKFFLYIKVKDFSEIYISELKKDPTNMDKLLIFQYYPEGLKSIYDFLIKTYTLDEIGNLSISGKEDLFYLLLRLSIKGKYQVSKKLLTIGNSVSIAYFKELTPFLNLK